MQLLTYKYNCCYQTVSCTESRISALFVRNSVVIASRALRKRGRGGELQLDENFGVQNNAFHLQSRLVSVRLPVRIPPTLNFSAKPERNWKGRGSGVWLGVAFGLFFRKPGIN